MQTALVCLCLCLLSTALSTPVPPPLPGRAAGNCVGQHRILLKGCNAKHGFYVFKYVYSFSTRRNQTQIKKEEAESQSTVPGRQLGDDDARQELTDDRMALKEGDNISTDVIENGTGLKPQNRSTPGTGRDAYSPRPGPGTRARGGVGIAGPTLASLESSGDLDLVVEVDSGDSILPQSGSSGEAMVGNRSGVRSEVRDNGASGAAPVEEAMTAGRERAPATVGAEDEGSGEATIPDQRQEGDMQGTGTGDASLASATEKMEDVQVDAKGMDEYAYIPDSSSVTVTSGKVGSTVRDTSFTQISPDKDDEVNIFIGRASIHVGEQETTQAGATVGSKEDSIPTAGTSSSLPRLEGTVARDGDDSSPAHRQPEGLATTATPSHWESIISTPEDGHPTGDDDDGATTVGDREGPVAPSPWRATDGDTTILVGPGIPGNRDGEARGEGQRFEGRPGHLAVTTPRQGTSEETTATVTLPAERASIRLGTTVASPRASEGNCTPALGMARGCKAGGSTLAGRGGSGEVGAATPQPRGERWPGAGAQVRLGGAGLDKTPRTDKVLSPRRKAGSQALGKVQAMAGGHGGDVGGRLRTTTAGLSTPLQAGRAAGSVVAGEGRGMGRSSEAGVAVVGARGGRLPGRYGRRPGAAVPGAFAALGHSRQVDQVKRANELHIRERAFYTLGGAAGGPRGPHSSVGSADSSQSSEGEPGSRSDSGQMGLRPSGYPHGRWSRGTL